MTYQLIGAVALGAIAMTTSVAYANQAEAPQMDVPAQLERELVLTACRQNRAETLPNPFVDLPRDHWAFKAVLTVHYCGALRQASPASVPERVNLLEPTSGKSE